MASARIFRGTKAEILRLARALRAGELVGVPTETVYGLAADGLNAKACARIFAAKGRPSSDPLIVHVAGISRGRQGAGADEVALVRTAARRLMEAFWPGPLTLVLPKLAVVPEVVTAGRDSVAVRAPAHPLMRKLLAAAGRPLAAPSANRFGYVSPTTAEHVREGLGEKIKYILDGGPCEIGVESTIVDLRDERRPRLLRPGKIGKREIERVLGTKVTQASGRGSSAGGAKPSLRGKGLLAPGMLARHYSPRTPVVLHRRLRVADVRAASGKSVWVFMRVPASLRGREGVFAWSRAGDLAGAARELFGVLRRLDAGGWEAIHVELAAIPRGVGRGLAEAINDRLRRAAALG